MKQLSGYPQALGMSAGVMLVLGLLPGVPMLPFLALGGGAAYLAVTARKRNAPTRKPKPSRRPLRMPPQPPRPPAPTSRSPIR